MSHHMVLVRTNVSEADEGGTKFLQNVGWATRCNIPEDAIPHNHDRENLKSYV
jgi:hypothetical protein